MSTSIRMTLAKTRLQALHEANEKNLAAAYAEVAERFGDDVNMRNAYLAGWLRAALEVTQNQLDSILHDEFPTLDL